MQNRYPWWVNVILIFVFVLCLLYAAPNLFGEDPAVQISAKNNAEITAQVVQTVQNALKEDNLRHLSTTKSKDGLLVRFSSTDQQLQARDKLQSALGSNYIVALNLASRTPGWLTALGANPMKLGLDLRGGVHFLLEVDINTLIDAHEKADMHSMGDTLRKNRIRYDGISQTRPNGILIRFRDQATLQQALSKLTSDFHDYQLLKQQQNGRNTILATLTPKALTTNANYAIDQAMNVLRNRVNALGVSEAVVQREGLNHISVDLPGIQDTTRAKSIIGKTATLRFQMVDEDHDAEAALQGDVPPGDKVYMSDDSKPVLLKERVILSGDAITFASASLDQNGRPSVNVRLSGGNAVSNFNRVTSDNIGKAMAVVYVETVPEKRVIDGQTVVVHHQNEKVISVATIQSALGNSFQITNLQSSSYAQDLALLLRSGALQAPLTFLQERTVGPSLGQANIRMGLISIIVGFVFIVLFMAFYYRLFGLFADMALFLNLVFIVAVFSLLGVTMTLPGIAAMVLTVGMAVDANVLIYERIREELRNGVSPQASIHLGYDRAFITIVDSNVTTLIVALVLFALGSGAVKGFAVTLIVGLLTSMLTAIVYTRSVANAIYGGKRIKKVSIGINLDRYLKNKREK